jgi:putative ABC transport system substrate-binding protein
VKRRAFITLLGGAAAAWPLAAGAQPATIMSSFLDDRVDSDMILDDIRTIVEIESPSRNAVGVNRVLETIARSFEGTGATCERELTPDSLGDILRMRCDPTRSERGILVLSHMDTVHPIGTLAGKLAYRREGDRVYGPGIYDMKGGLMLAVAAFRRIAQAGRRTKLPITFLLIEAAGHTLGVGVQVFNASGEREIDAVFSALARAQSKALIVSNDALFTIRRERIVSLAAHDAVPAIYAFREFVAAGGLMNYGPDFVDAYHQVGVYTGRTLKGEKPGELPVQQPTKFELVINAATAKALGLDIPPTLIARADEVIE